MYQDLSKEEKEQKRQYVSKRYKNLPRYSKQTLVKYRRKSFEYNFLKSYQWFKFAQAIKKPVTLKKFISAINNFQSVYFS